MPLSRRSTGRTTHTQSRAGERSRSCTELAGAQCPTACVEKGGLMRTHRGVLRLALAAAALLGSLSLVVWRQSRALELLRELDRTRTERAIAEASRSDLNRRIEYLESRSRVVTEAARLGLRVPTGDEIVFLPLDDRPSSTRSPLAVRVGAAAGTMP